MNIFSFFVFFLILQWNVGNYNRNLEKISEYLKKKRVKSCVRNAGSQTRVSIFLSNIDSFSCCIPPNALLESHTILWLLLKSYCMETIIVFPCIGGGAEDIACPLVTWEFRPLPKFNFRGCYAFVIRRVNISFSLLCGKRTLCSLLLVEWKRDLSFHLRRCAFFHLDQRTRRSKTFSVYVLCTSFRHSRSWNNVYYIWGHMRFYICIVYGCISSFISVYSVLLHQCIHYC